MTTPVRVSALPPGTAFSRYLMAKAVQDQSGYHGAIELAKRWRDTPQVHATLGAECGGTPQAGFDTKAAVAAGNTTDSTWAGPLAGYGIAGEALELLRGASILGMLEGRFRRVPFTIKIARETGSGTGGAWIGQGLSTPVAPTAYDTLTQEAYKAGVIVPVTRELLQFSNPSAERTLRDTVIAGVAAYLDQQLLTNTVTLSAGLRPAAITNGATAVTSTGTTAAQITADLVGLIAAITTNGANLVWVLRPITAARIAATLGAAAADMPRTLFGIPLVLSANSPQQITIIDCAHILYSDDGGFDVDISQQASIQLDTAPAEPSVAATVFTSLFQFNMFAVKVTRWIAYLRAQSGSVAYMTVSY